MSNGVGETRGGMNIITKRMKIRETIDTWVNGKYCSHVPKYEKISELLGALNPDTASADVVESIIGNSSWTEIICDECGEDVMCAVELGGHVYEGDVACLCLGCVRKALEELEGSFVPMVEICY